MDFALMFLKVRLQTCPIRLRSTFINMAMAVPPQAMMRL